MTNRTRTMFGPPGHLYVYFTYGMHHCANVVCGEDGVCSAVLLRAAAPLDADLCSGPARLCQAFGLDRRHDGADLTTVSTPPARGSLPIFIVDDGTPPPTRPGRSGRIGVTRAPNRLWRFHVAGDANVSRGPRA